jgi:hypothetical protein
MPITVVIGQTSVLLMGCGIVGVIVSWRVKRGVISRKDTGLAWIGASLVVSALSTLGRTWFPEGPLSVLLALHVIFTIVGLIYLLWPV